MMESSFDRASWRGVKQNHAPSDDTDWPEFALKVQAQEIDDVGKACYRSLADSGAFHTVSGDGVLFQEGIDDTVIEMRGYNGASSLSREKGPLATEADDEHGVRRDFPVMSYYVPSLSKTICGSGHIALERNGAWIFRPPGCTPKGFQTDLCNHDSFHWDDDGTKFPLTWDPDCSKWFLKLYPRPKLKIPAYIAEIEKSVGVGHVCAAIDESIDCWHRRLDHMSKHNIYYMAEKGLVEGMTISESYKSWRQQ